MELLQKNDFSEIVLLIDSARQKAYQAVNTTLIELYWQVGGFISKKIQSVEWGDKVIADLAKYLATTHPNLKGFALRNSFRMRQFYEAYFQNAIVSPLVTQLYREAINILKDSYLVEKQRFLHREKRELHGVSQRRNISNGFCNNFFFSVKLCVPLYPSLCKSFFNRSLSPALIAEYQTKLPEKKLLQAKLHEFYVLNIAEAEEL